MPPVRVESPPPNTSARRSEQRRRYIVACVVVVVVSYTLSFHCCDAFDCDIGNIVSNITQPPPHEDVRCEYDVTRVRHKRGFRGIRAVADWLTLFKSFKQRRQRRRNDQASQTQILLLCLLQQQVVFTCNLLLWLYARSQAGSLFA